MPQVRKTRQQKIMLSERKTNQAISGQSEAISGIPRNPMPMSHAQEIEETQRYVVDELKRIGWISLACAAILILATIFLADFSWAQSIRNLLSI